MLVKVEVPHGNIQAFTPNTIVQTFPFPEKVFT